ncbi:AAA-16 domain-containing protein [Phanerochaete sordida]|uniref:AAA-16 domain-containing protein n=1 Tax=Phanerochaete sordida TaxID=48140 RepID=A0A9P3GKV4_9APHY|nr:AAA-16 domain-containing protein [Phanerochaete sordida]
MDGAFNIARYIDMEFLLWEDLAKRRLDGTMLPNMLKAAEKMAKTVDAIRGKPFEDVVLVTFCRSSIRLNCVLQETDSKIKDVLRFDLHGEPIGASDHFRHMIASSKELQAREQDLLSAIAQVQNQASGLRSRKGSRVIDLIGSLIRTRADNDAILKGMTEKIDSSAALFQAGASTAIDECISSVANLQQRKEEFRLAEQAAQFIERISSGAGSYHAADDAQHGSDPAASMQEDIAADVKQWLSGSKHVYLLTGEPNTGKSQNARGLCHYLSAARSSTAKLGGSFFLAPGDEDLESLQFALLSLSYQVAPPFRTMIVDDIREFLYCGEDVQLRHAAIDLLPKCLVAASSGAQATTVLVLDGIDQCSESLEVPGLLRRLLAFVREFPWLFLFIAACPRPNVMAVLAHPTVSDIVYHRQLDDDIERWHGNPAEYFQYTLPRIPAYKDYSNIHPNTLRELSQLANGDIRFAQLAMRYLHAENRRPEARLNRLRSIANSDSPLEALYIHQLETLAPFLSPDRPRFPRTLLRFVAHTGCSLTPDEISSFAHEISADDVIRTVDDFRAVLTIDTSWKIVPHDVSFSRFLRNMNRKGELPFGLQADGALHAASICIAAISNTSPVTAIPRLLPPPNLLPRDGRPQPTIPFMSLWPRYLSESRPSADPDLILQLDAFVPSLPLAMYAWVVEPFDAHCAASIVARYLVTPHVDLEEVDDVLEKTLSIRRRIISDFYAFVCYVQLRRDRGDQHIFAADIIQAIAEGCQDKIVYCNTGLHGPGDLTFTFNLEAEAYQGHVSVGADSLQSYKSITEDFLTQMQNAEQVGNGPSTPGLLEGTFRAALWT